MLRKPPGSLSPSTGIACFLLLALAGTSPVAAEDKICSKPAETAMKDARTFTRSLQTALAQGDIVAMDQTFIGYMGRGGDNLGDYGNCQIEQKADFVKACGLECHMAIGQYLLFHTGDIQFYSSVAKTSVSGGLLDPGTLVAFGTRGQGILDADRELLIGQIDSAADQATAFRTFLVNAARYDQLRAELYLAIGDQKYLSASEFGLLRLSREADALTRPIASTAHTGDLYLARSDYEDALWILSEALLGVPDIEPFSTIRREFKAIEAELARRIDSIDRGDYYIGINPDTASVFSLGALRSELQTTGAEVQRLEESMEGLLSRSLDAKTAADVAAVDDKRFALTESSTLSTYRIASLEETAKTFGDEIAGELRQLEGSAIPLLEQTQRRNEIDFNLEKRVAELTNQKQQILDRTNVEILNIKSEEAARHLADVRWLMSWNVTKASLDLQIAGLQAQVEQYQRDTERSESEQRQIELRKQAAQKEIDIANESVKQAKLRQASLGDTKTKVFQEQKTSLLSSICEVQTRLAFFGAEASSPIPWDPTSCPKPSIAIDEKKYFEAVCNRVNGLKPRMQQLGIDKLALQLKCVIGDVSLVPQDLRSKIGLDQQQCPFSPDTTQIEMAQQIFKAEQAEAEKQNQNLVARKDRIRELANQVRQNAAAAKTDQEKLLAETSGLSAIMVTAAASPQTGAVLGPSGGAIVLPQQFNAASAAYQIARDAAQTDATISEGQRSARIAGLNIDDQLAQLAADVDLTPQQTKIRELYAARAMAQIRGASLPVSKDLQQAMMEQDLVSLDCSKMDASDAIEVASLQAHHRQLVANMKSAEASNQLVDNDIGIEESRIAQQMSQIAELNVKISELDEQRRDTEAASKTARDLKQSVTDRLTKLNNLTGDLANLENEQNQASDALAKLEEEKIPQELNLKNDQVRYLENAIRQSQTEHEALAAVVDKIKEKYGKDADLTVKLQAFQKDTNDKISSERNALISSLRSEKPDDKDKLLRATQDQVADFIRGMPAYATSKRRLAERANVLLNLLRARVRDMTMAAGQIQADNEQIYVRTADELKALTQTVADAALWSQAPVVIETAKITVPESSGLARELAGSGRASFEITPYAAGRMPGLGYFAVWSPDFSPDRFGQTQNLILVDFNVGIFFSSPGCVERRYSLTHEGSGFVFRDASAGDSEMLPRFIVSPPRSKNGSYLSLADDGETRLKMILGYWSRDHFLHSFLVEGEGPPNDPSSSLPLLGLPLFARYDLVLSSAPDGCSYADSTFVLYPTFATAPRPVQ